MRKNIVLIALITFMFVFSLQAIQPAAAAKLKVVDKGHYTVKNPILVHIHSHGKHISTKRVMLN